MKGYHQRKGEDAFPGSGVLFIVGATAVGKTAVGIELAKRVDGEIVSVDSMQVYRGLDILSAKPPRAQLERVPHHLIDILDPGERFDVSRFIRLAAEAIAAIRSRGRVAIVVGGAGMYVRALIDGIFEGPGRNPELRKRLEREADESGLPALFERLKSADSEAARRIHPNDKRRIIRALEVFESEGKPLSALQTEWRRKSEAPEGMGAFFSRNLDCRVVICGVRRGREDIRRRIDERVELMFDEGVVEEVRRLLKKSSDRGSTIWQALGLNEIRRFIEGRCTLEDAKSALRKSTRAYAKRQLTWFEADSRIVWLDLERGEEAAITAERVMNLTVHSTPGVERVSSTPGVERVLGGLCEQQREG